MCVMMMCVYIDGSVRGRLQTILEKKRHFDVGGGGGGGVQARDVTL